MRPQIITNPDRTSERDMNIYSGRDTTLPNVSTTLKPIEKGLENLEAEKGELVLSNDLSTVHKILGKSHAKGGTPLNLPEGSFIFSKDKSLAISKPEQKIFGFKQFDSAKKEDNTPAKLVEKLIDIKHYNQMSAILNNERNRDITAKNTAAVTIAANQEKLGQIAYLQEQRKQFRDGVPQFSQGTEPIYSDDVKNDIITEKQYMKYGGTSGYKPKMQYGGIGPSQSIAQNFFMLHPEARFKPRSTPYEANNLPYGYKDPNYIANLVQSFNGITGNNYDASPAGLNLMRQSQMQNYPEFIKAAGDMQYWNRNATDDKNYDDVRPYYDAIGAYSKSFNNEPEKDLYFKENGFNPLDKKYGNNLASKIDPVTGRFIGLKYTFPNSPIAAASGQPPAAQPATTSPSSLTPNKAFVSGVYTNQRVPFNDGQIASLAGTTLLNGMRKNIFPQRTENSFIPLELEKVNPNAALQDNASTTLQGSRIAATLGMNPSQAAAYIQKATADGITNANNIRDKYDTQNVQIGNQQNQYNNQGFNQMRGANVQNNNLYNNLVNTTLGRANEEKINGNVDLLNKGLGYYAENKAMQHALNAMQQYPVLDPNTGQPVLDKNGNQVYNTPYSLGRNGDYVFNHTNGFDMLTTPRDEYDNDFIRQLYSEWTNEKDPKIKAELSKQLTTLNYAKQRNYSQKRKYGGMLNK